MWVVMYTKQDKDTICLHPNPGRGAISLQSIPDQDMGPAREYQNQKDAEAPWPSQGSGSARSWQHPLLLSAELLVLE